MGLDNLCNFVASLVKKFSYFFINHKSVLILIVAAPSMIAFIFGPNLGILGAHLVACWEILESAVVEQ